MQYFKNINSDISINKKNTQIMAVKYMKKVKIYILYIERLSNFEDIPNLLRNTKKIPHA